MRTIVLTICTGLAVIGAALGVYQSSQSSDASIRSNTTVVVVKDLTSTSSCKQTYEDNVGTARMTSVTTTCSPGTIVGPTYVTLSAARAQHEAYLTSLNSGATARVQAAFAGQLKQLETQVANIAHTAHASESGPPGSPCGGGEHSLSVQWTIPDDGDGLGRATLKSTTTWTVPACLKVDIGPGSLEVLSECGDCYGWGAIWSEQQYAGADWKGICGYAPYAGDSVGYNTPSNYKSYNYYVVDWVDESSYCLSNDQIDLGPV